MEYKQAPEAEAIATGTVIPKWKKELAKFQIVYVLVEKIKSRGDDVWAKIKKLSAFDKHVSGSTWHSSSTRKSGTGSRRSSGSR